MMAAEEQLLIFEGASAGRYRSGDAPAMPPCPRTILPATASMQFNQRFPSNATANIFLTTTPAVL